MPHTFKKTPDAPWIESRRPAAEIIKSLVIETLTSASEHASAWTQEDDVRLICAKEFDNLDWVAVNILFPLRRDNSVERRYNRYLVLDKV
jgi:hypothetical protein